jgi:hypothetical protein
MTTIGLEIFGVYVYDGKTFLGKVKTNELYTFEDICDKRINLYCSICRKLCKKSRTTSKTSSRTKKRKI